MRNNDNNGGDNNDNCRLRRCLDNELRRLCEYACLSPEELDARKAEVERVRAASAVLFSGTTDNDDDDRMRVEIFGLFATLNMCVYSSNVDLSLWGVADPTKNIDEDEEEEEKPKSQTTTTTATHKDRVRKWANVLDETERLHDANNYENGVSGEGDVKRPMDVDDEEKSGKWKRTTDLSLRVVVGAVPNPRLFALDDLFAVAVEPRTEERGDDDQRQRHDV